MCVRKVKGGYVDTTKSGKRLDKTPVTKKKALAQHRAIEARIHGKKGK